MERLDNYQYQYDLDGFPVARAQDLANRMRFHRVKLLKLCPVCNKEMCLNKVNHFCLGCKLDFYIDNTQITEFFPEEKICPM